MIDGCISLQASKKPAYDINETPVSIRMEFFSFFDKNQPPQTLTQVEFIALNGKIGSKRAQHTNVVSISISLAQIYMNDFNSVFVFVAIVWTLSLVQLKRIIVNAEQNNDTADSDSTNIVNLSIAEMKHSLIGENTAIKIRTSPVPKQRTKLINGLHDAHNYMGKVYETDLIVLDKTGKCVLDEGEYELKLNVRSLDADSEYKDVRNNCWQELPRLYADNNFGDHPTLKFRLLWSRADHHVPQDCNGNVNQRNANSIQVRDGNCSDSSNGGERDMTTSSRSSSKSSSSSSSGHGTMTDKFIKPTANGNNKAIVRLRDCTSRIIYRFIYNKNMSQQTETFENWNCPWCKLNCIRLDSLMIHLRLTHDDFEFGITPTSQAVIIDVTIRKRQGVTKRRLSRGRVKPKEELFFYRSKKEKRLTPAATAAKMALNNATMMDCDDEYYARTNRQQVVSFAPGHNRLYYHSQSCMPIYTSEEFNEDSEGEPDPAWLTQNCNRLVNDFTDVNEGEKEIMNLWNAHVMERNYVGDVQMADACNHFIYRYGRELIHKNLYRNFLLHLTNLYDFGLITCGTVHEMATKLQQLHRTELNQQYLCCP